METKGIAAALRERSSLMDTAEVAELLQTRKETVLRYVHQGKLPAPIKIGDLLRWDPKIIADALESDKIELAKQVAAWLCARVSGEHEYVTPEPLKKVLVTLPGYEAELKAAHDSRCADKEEFLHYLRKRLRYKCEVLLTREELVELLAQLPQEGARNE